ncbi:MAG: hypothetical protein KUG67_03630 [Proteobacteria bacterium]|nr:hypothetical protein [Pseudomonadota bacterium]
MEIKNLREAELFDEYLASFQERENAPSVPHIKMHDVYKVLEKVPESGRLFGFMSELLIQLALLNVDLCKISDLNGKAKEFEEYSGKDVFCNRLSLLKANSDYIFRYRAIWDKLMSVFILLFKKDKFQDFSKSKSRKKSFMKIMKGVHQMDDSLLKSIEKTITDFDEMYRTNEIHGSGSTRKWSFTHTESPFSHQSNMHWAWNDLNSVVYELGNLFSGAAKHSEP